MVFVPYLVVLLFRIIGCPFVGVCFLFLSSCSFYYRSHFLCRSFSFLACSVWLLLPILSVSPWVAVSCSLRLRRGLSVLFFLFRISVGRVSPVHHFRGRLFSSMCFSFSVFVSFLVFFALCYVRCRSSFCRLAEVLVTLRALPSLCFGVIFECSFSPHLSLSVASVAPLLFFSLSLSAHSLFHCLYSGFAVLIRLPHHLHLSLPMVLFPRWPFFVAT